MKSSIGRLSLPTSSSSLFGSPSLLLRAFSVAGLVCLCLSAALAAQEDDKTSASGDLEAAFDRKIQAKTIGDFDEVVKLCKSALEKGLESEDEKEAKMLASSALYEHAQQLVARIGRRGNAQLWRNQALARLREATEFNPDQSDAWMMIAKLNVLRGGDVDEARTAVDRVIGMADDEPKKLSQAHFFRSVLERAADPTEGREDLDRAIELDKGNMDALRARTGLRIGEGDVEGAIEDSDLIIEANEGNDKVLMAQAMSLRQFAGLKLAQSERKKAREEADDEDEDDDGESVEELKEASESLAKKSLEYIDDAIKANSEQNEYYFIKGQTHMLLEQEDEALEAINTLLEKDDTNIGGWLYKAVIFQVQKKTDEELECLDKALNLDPYNPDTLDRRRVFFARQGDFEQALEEAKKFNDAKPDFDSMNNLAVLYSVNNQPKKALEIYNSLLSQIPNTGQIEAMTPPARAIALAVTRVSLLRSRADAYLATSEHGDAVDDYEEALELADLVEEIQNSVDVGAKFGDEEIEGVLNNLSWVLATSTDDEVRDGDRALEFGLRACEASDYKKPHILSTLASAYAEKGDFDKAIEWIEKGLELNEKNREKDDADMEAIDQQKESLEKELAFYKDGKPWRENQAEEDKEKAEKEKAEKEKAKKDKDDKKKAKKDDDSEDDDDDSEDDK